MTPRIPKKSTGLQYTHSANDEIMTKVQRIEACHSIFYKPTFTWKHRGEL